jgi:hypothetical protein
MHVVGIAMLCICILVHHGREAGRGSELYGRARSERWLEGSAFRSRRTLEP